VDGLPSGQGDRRRGGLALNMRIGHLRPAVVPQVTGMAYRTGDHTFVVDPADPLVPGFVPR
jgi:proline racemase